MEYLLHFVNQNKKDILGKFEDVYMTSITVRAYRVKLGTMQTQGDPCSSWVNPLTVGNDYVFFKLFS